MTISESAVFAPVTVQAQNAGAQYNIQPSQNWASPQLGGVTVQNAIPFSNGSDDIPERKGLYPQRQKGVGPTDTQLQRALDVSHQVIRGMIGLKDTEDFPDDSRTREAVFLLSMYRLENNLTQEAIFAKPTLHATSPQETRYFRANVYRHLMNQVAGLISHLTKWERIINGEEAQSA